MSHQNSHSVPESETPVSGFLGQSQMGLPEVLQMCCLSRRSGQITFRSGESYGFIFVQHGRVLHAMCGTIEGEEAIYTMLTWPGGGFSLNEDILPHRKTVTLTWEQLLFEGARRADQGIGAFPANGATVTTAAPAHSTRPQESMPKLTVMRPDLPPALFELVQEFTHVGRATGNEICLPYPSVSNRHCMFIKSGPDIVLRDLNSSNGTLVNDAAVNEVVLRPGDTLQMGVVEMKFEAGMKRPKLLASTSAPLKKLTEPLKMAANAPMLTHETVKLPTGRARPPGDPNLKDDSAFVKGESAISYAHLAKPEGEKKSKLGLIIGVVVVLVLLGAAGFYFFVMK